METPTWALEIVTQECRACNLALPTLHFRQSRVKLATSGSTNRTRGRIVVTLGTKGDDHLQVLLHELAQLLMHMKPVTTKCSVNDRNFQDFVLSAGRPEPST